MKTVSFVAASSNSGKTTLVEKVVRILKSRGLRVAVVKHASKGFDIDVPGKDSWRFREAGADTVVLVGPGRLAVQKRMEHEPTEQDISAFVADADVLIKEGFKHDAGSRIEVFREGVSGDRPMAMADDGITAIVSDRPLPVVIPWFDLNDADGVAEFIITKFKL